MISTPICDFASAYEKSRAVRLHMPGHKGAGPLGFEGRDLKGGISKYSPGKT